MSYLEKRDKRHTEKRQSNKSVPYTSISIGTFNSNCIYAREITDVEDTLNDSIVDVLCEHLEVWGRVSVGNVRAHVAKDSKGKVFTVGSFSSSEERRREQGCTTAAAGQDAVSVPHSWHQFIKSGRGQPFVHATGTFRKRVGCVEVLDEVVLRGNHRTVVGQGRSRRRRRRPVGHGGQGGGSGGRGPGDGHGVWVVAEGEVDLLDEWGGEGWQQQ